ncbi:MAG: hypothetical protein M3Q05_10350 [Bacteroidota bacterium]|nr:hypothetical protein [Bacteroidota bacterium]
MVREFALRSILGQLLTGNLKVNPAGLFLPVGVDGHNLILRFIPGMLVQDTSLSVSPGTFRSRVGIALDAPSGHLLHRVINRVDVILCR